MRYLGSCRSELIVIFQILVQMVLLGWLAMADVMDNPYGFHKIYDVNLIEVFIGFLTKLFYFRSLTSTSGVVPSPSRV